MHLQTVLARIQSAGLSVKLKKSKFANTSCGAHCREWGD